MSIGVDIARNDRFSEIIKDQNKLSKILSKYELEYFNNITSEKRKLEYVASRFATKEAIFKATNIVFKYNSVSILNEENGKPYIKSDNELINSLQVSLSHEDNYSISFVIK